MAAILAIVKPILLAFVASDAVKKLLIDLLRALVKQTDNTLDDQAVDIVAGHLLK